MIEADLAKHLRTRKAIRNRIGSRGVFRGRVPQNYDGQVAIVLDRIGGDPLYNLSGEDTLAEVTISVDVIAKRANGEPIAEQLEEDIRDAISGYRGTWADTTVRGCTKTGQPREIRTPPVDGSDDWSYRISTDYRIHYVQTAPTLGD